MSESPAPSTTTDKPAAPPLPLSAVLLNLRGGLADSDAGKALAEVVAACLRTGAKGSVTLKLHVEVVDSAGGTPRVFLQDEVTAKAPSEPNPHSLFFVHGESLRTTDPQQVLFDRSMRGEAVQP